MPPSRPFALLARASALAAVALTLACAASSPGGGSSGSGSGAQVVPAVLWFEEFNEVLAGVSVRLHPLLPQAIDIRTQVGNTRCVGDAVTRVMPPDARPPERCDGVGGTAVLTCSDGSSLELEWLSDPGCSSGYGRGVDQEGRLVHFVFGGSQERAAAATREALAERRDMPMVPGPSDGGTTGGSSSGTAFFVGWDGLLLTNYHVIEDKEKIQVLLDDGDLVNAEVVNSDPENDIALLRVDAIREPLALLRENALQRGDEVVVLGYPLVPLQGIEQKATFGRVNALSGLRGDERYAQMDAAIQPGNSGGPMLNRRGEVVGVVSAMLNQLATMQIAGVVPQNVNYALKADFAHTHLRRTLEGWSSEGKSVDAVDWIELIQTLENSVVLVLAE